MSSIRLNSQFELIFIAFIGLCVALSFPANLLRLYGVDFFAESYPKIILIFSFFLASINLALVFNKKVSLYVFFIVLLYSCFLSYILVVGVLRGNSGIIYGLKYFILPVVAVFFLMGRGFLFFFYKSSGFWKLILFSHLLLFCVYIFLLYGKVYPGIGVSSLAYSALFFFVNGNPLLFCISSLLILLEGKRSVLVSMLLALALCRLIDKKALTIFISIFLYLIVFLVFSILALYLMAYFDGFGAFDRINLINPFSGRFDLAVGSSGRYGELVSAFGDRTLGELFAGMGAGFEYQWDLGYESQQSGETKGYLHISPANYLLIGGVFGCLIFIFISSLPFFAKRMPGDPKVRKVAFCFGIYSILQSSFGFNFATDIVTLVLIIGPFILASAGLRPHDGNRAEVQATQKI
ncbi:hypothetical protein [Marinobacter adhaerens]|uniref:hypothetical protein n=1 Tax=Marinobacter adhaerens TaxID=1033846 RepID=UPI003BAAC801